MFGREKKKHDSPAVPPKPGGKGRPTPSRKEAEQAARQRAKAPRSRKEMTAAQRQAEKSKRVSSSREIREGMKRGDERFLGPRDRGPVRRFIRDFVDSRFSFLELVLPLMIVTLALGYSGNAYLAGVGNNILLGTVLLMLIETLIMRFRLKRELAARFAGADVVIKRPLLYAVLRATQLRFMRMPKPRVKIGQPLPGDYS
ncbi:DUF3043 domain-containing protein [Nocardioides limicola]|uniref:DUF3043 domain-containing protein n=1 Tax=Nocardioides limicola TaxID=2803368 RepID=UPI00193C202A|nr:DUF3043 domain-containing protein [Nocardioides sp. DJM-14]